MTNVNDPEPDEGLETALPTIERRYHRRYPAGLPAWIEVNGARRSVTIADLSLGGAGLSPAFPALVGARIGIEIDGLEPPYVLPARVLNTSREKTHVLFECTQDEQTAIIIFLLTDGSRE